MPNPHLKRKPRPPSPSMVEKVRQLQQRLEYEHSKSSNIMTKRIKSDLKQRLITYIPQTPKVFG